MFRLSDISWIFLVSFFIQFNSFVVKDTFNMMLKDSTDYKINQTINDDDYEMIPVHQIRRFKIDDRFDFHNLDKIASEKYKQSFNSTVSFLYEFKAAKHVTEKVKIVMKNLPRTSRHSVTQRNAVNNNVIEYNYEELIDEYYDEVLGEASLNNIYHARKIEYSESGFVNSVRKIFSLDLKTRNCTHETTKQIGLKAIVCLMKDYKEHSVPIKILAIRFWNIAKIWLLVYVAVAVPLWCTRGWFCCCLFCKFFKPRQTIENAKKYLVLHPPGILMTNVGEIHYEPTEQEKESYEEFEHFIRTL